MFKIPSMAALCVTGRWARGSIVGASALLLQMVSPGAAHAQAVATNDEAPATKSGTLSSVPAAPELVWPLPASAPRSYDSIDGQRMRGYVEELAAISRKSHDKGNQYWGRIAGQESGDETQHWLEAKFHAIGLDVQVRQFPMAPQEIPRSWDVSVSGGGKTIGITSASPLINFEDYMPANEGDITLDTVWCGLGMPSDFVGKDVRGKAVFIYSIPTPSSLVQSAAWMKSAERAQRLGAKALVIVLAIPGNMHFVSHLVAVKLSKEAKLPIFTAGLDDGERVETLNAALSGKGLTTRLQWKVEHVEGLKAANVIGVLPGRTDEAIVMIAHTDAFFEGATDNGAGTAALVETAAYYAKIPKAQRRRTMYFIGTPDHHNGDLGARWLHDNFQPVFARTAVLLNAEHIAAAEPVWDRKWGTSVRPGLIATNQIGSSWWGVNGSDKLAHIVADAYARFGVPTQIAEGGSPGELRQVQFDAPSFYLHNKGVYYHADADVPAVVPATGLRTGVQAFLEIFDAVNKLDIAALRPPAAPTK